MKALGCHVFAGGFTMGVKQVCQVDAQLEVHGLGQETVESMGVDFIMGNNQDAWDDDVWEPMEADFLFGNPRCTGFSCLTGKHGPSVHGAWSEPTKDIHQFMHYGIRNNIPVICWESVQQAWSVGRPLLDHIRDTMCIPNGYRIAHLFINAATFGNAQHRKRYFFVAYKSDKNFNIVPPQVVPQHATVWDKIECLQDLKVEMKKHPRQPDHHWHSPRSEIIQHIPQGYDLNKIGHKCPEILEKVPYFHDLWENRTSDLPFSLHSLCRLSKDGYMPVISGSSHRYVHPLLDRTLTIRECARLMGWPDDITPIGDNPFGQIGKGICPEIGVWLAEQVKLYHEDHWKEQDWESSYDDKKGEWVGRHDPGQEKIFNLTRYAPGKP